MGRKVTFTRKQMEHIMECNGIPQEKYDEILEATTCGSVGTGTTRGDMGYDTPGFNTSDKKFWGDALNHQKAGFERVGEKKKK